ARDNDLLNPILRQDKLGDCRRDGPSRQFGGSGNKIFERRSLAVLKHVTHKCIAELFASGSLGRTGQEEWLCQQLFQQISHHPTCSSNRAVCVICLLPVCKPAHQRIDHHVPWTGIERLSLFDRRAWRERSDVCDSADIQQNTTLLRISKKQVI